MRARAGTGSLYRVALLISCNQSVCPLPVLWPPASTAAAAASHLNWAKLAKEITQLLGRGPPRDVADIHCAKVLFSFSSWCVRVPNTQQNKQTTSIESSLSYRASPAHVSQTSLQIKQNAGKQTRNRNQTKLQTVAFDMFFSCIVGAGTESGVCFCGRQQTQKLNP